MCGDTVADEESVERLEPSGSGRPGAECALGTTAVVREAELRFVVEVGCEEGGAIRRDWWMLVVGG